MWRYPPAREDYTLLNLKKIVQAVHKIQVSKLLCVFFPNFFAQRKKSLLKLANINQSG